MTHAWKRWVPAVMVPAVIVAAALTVPLAANATASLPTKSAAQVLAMIAQSNVKALSGTVEQQSNLGLPDIGSLGSSVNSSTSSALELLAGTHKARVYLDGATKARVQVLDSLAERDVIRSGNDVWLYSSSNNTATHVALPSRTDKQPSQTPGVVPTPAELANKFLAAIDSTTAVTVSKDVSVAGRSAYDLVVTPRSSTTLIGSVSIAVDSATGLPLSVDVTARGAKAAAFSVAFTSLSLTTPSADLFAFTPPKGATVKQQALPPTPPKGEKPSTSAKPSAVTGTGWDSVIEVPSSAVPTSLSGSSLLNQLTTAVAGGRLLHTSLVNVLLTTDGRVFAGAVSSEQLQAAAAGK
jgi:outer membrane lipoprotein-sorting protein